MSSVLDGYVGVVNGLAGERTERSRCSTVSGAEDRTGCPLCSTVSGPDEQTTRVKGRLCPRCLQCWTHWVAGEGSTRLERHGRSDTGRESDRYVFVRVTYLLGLLYAQNKNGTR